MEEDLKKFNHLFFAIRLITYIICGLFALAGIIAFINEKNIGILIVIAALLINMVILFFVSLHEILIVRFLSATQNMYEITVMLEKHFNEENEN